MTEPVDNLLGFALSSKSSASNRILSKSQIYTEYESFKDKNPPVI